MKIPDKFLSWYQMHWKWYLFAAIFYVAFVGAARLFFSSPISVSPIFFALLVITFLLGPLLFFLQLKFLSFVAHVFGISSGSGQSDESEAEEKA